MGRTRRILFLQRTFQESDLLKDMLVLTSSSGHVFSSYLGTDPSIFTVPAPITREVNYEETDREFAELQEHIRASQAGGGANAGGGSDGLAPPAAAAGDLTVECAVGTQFQRSYFEGEFANNNSNSNSNTSNSNEEDESWVPTTKITVTLKSQTPLSKVRLTLSVEEPLKVTEDTHVINSLSTNSKLITVVHSC